MCTVVDCLSIFERGVFFTGQGEVNARQSFESLNSQIHMHHSADILASCEGLVAVVELDVHAAFVTVPHTNYFLSKI